MTNMKTKLNLKKSKYKFKNVKRQYKKKKKIVTKIGSAIAHLTLSITCIFVAILQDWVD